MDQNEQISMESVAAYLGALDLTIIALREQLAKANKGIEDLQQQLLKIQKEK
jgi:hypothetical protein